MAANALFGWVWILIGLLAGAAIGMKFSSETWLGGYSSWSRRMLRLGHIAFVGTGLLNIAYAVTVATALVGTGSHIVSGSFVVGRGCHADGLLPVRLEGALPALFFIPVGSLLLAVGLLVWQGISL